MDTQSKSKPPSVKVFWLVWLTTVALVAGSFSLLRFGRLAAAARVFRRTAHGWESVPPLGSSSYDIRISGSGVVWVQTAKGLSRLDGLAKIGRRRCGGSGRERRRLLGGQAPLAGYANVAAAGVYLAAHMAATFTDSLKKRQPKPSDPSDPGGPPRYDWAKSLPAILGGLAVAVLIYGGSIARHFHIGWLAAIPGTALFFGGGFLMNGYDMFRGHLVERELKRCRYGKALEMLDGPLGWPTTGLPKMVRADVVFFSGRAREAEPILRELVETKNDKGHKTLVFEHLGRVLLAQNRYEDARRAFEAAANLMPARAAAYSGLAELRLLQGVGPVQALEDAERALQLHCDSLLERKTAKERLATIRDNQAWALARLGRGAESQQAIEAGAREMDRDYISGSRRILLPRGYGDAGDRECDRRRRPLPPRRGPRPPRVLRQTGRAAPQPAQRSEEHTSELQSP